MSCVADGGGKLSERHRVRPPRLGKPAAIVSAISYKASPCQSQALGNTPQAVASTDPGPTSRRPGQGFATVAIIKA